LITKVNIIKTILKKQKVVSCIIILILFKANINIALSQHKDRYDSLLSKYYNIGNKDDTSTIRMLYALSVEAADAGIQDHVENSRKIPGDGFYNDEALKLSIKLNYDKGIELYFKTLSEIYQQQVFLPLIGLTDYDYGIPVQKFKDFRLFRNKKHNGSLNHYLRALNLLEKLNVKEKNYLIYYWIGLIYYDWFNFNRAIEYFKLALSCDEIKSDSITFSDVCINYGAAYFYAGKPDSAKKYFKKASLITEKLNDPFRSGVCALNTCEVFIHQKDIKNALEYCEDAALHFKLSKDTVSFAYSMNELAALYIQCKRFKPAEKILHEIPSGLHPSDKKLISSKIYRNLANIYEATGNYREANVYITKSFREEESLMIDDISGYFRYNEENWQNVVGREITKKESEALKRNETSIELSKSRLFLILMGSLIILINIIAIYTYRLYHLKHKANIYLSELNKSKEKLLSVISHDIRGPIIGLINLLEPISQNVNNLSPSQITDYIGQIINLSQNIRLLIDNLLEWTKSQQGLIVYHPETILLIEVVQSNIDIYMQIACSKNILIENDIPDSLKVLADRNMINIIIRNLLNNAVKFTGQNGHIIIKSEKEEDTVVISFTDDGIGMSEETICLLFPEDKITVSNNRKAKNAGLGLMLCKEYTEKCGGRIWALSGGSGKGSVFSFTVKSKQNHEKD
jgi:two-component system, sensor histidine kinase and response regulator